MEPPAAAILDRFPSGYSRPAGCRTRPVPDAPNKPSRGLMNDPSISLCCHKTHSRMRDYNRGRTMKAKRAGTLIGGDQETLNIERLHLELAAFNRRIAELERLHPEGPKIEILKASALLISRQIDELRCLSATEELTGLLAK
jgi:hypothetical protein